MAILVDFSHPLFKLEKYKSFGQPSEEQIVVYHGQNLKKNKFILRLWNLHIDMASIDLLHWA